MTESLIGLPPPGWMTLTLGELCARGGGDVQTGPFGSQLHSSDYVPVGIPSVMPVNIGDNRVVPEGIARITEADAHRLARHRLRVGDIVYSRRGDVERRALIREREAGWLCGTGCLRIRAGSGVSGKWLSYYLAHPGVRAWIVRHAVGATMPNLNASILSGLPVTVPPLRIQEGIAVVLGALDDKIECNRSMVELLRQVSSAQFERALSAAGTNVEFITLKSTVGQRRFVKTGPFGSLLHASDYAETGTPLILVKHVANGLVLRDGLPQVSEARSNELKEYYLATEDIVVTRVGRVGDAAIIHPSQAGWLFSGQMLRVRLDSEHFEPYWIFGYMLTRSFRDHIDNYAVGSTRQSLSVQLLESIPVPVVPMDLQRHFAGLVRPLWRLIEALRVESDRLAGLRNALLPGLLSGAIPILTSESIAGEVV